MAEDEKNFAEKARRLTDAIQSECYDARDKMFYSVDVDIKTRPYDWFHKGLGVFWKTLFIKVRCWSNFLPMLTEIATPTQAAALKDHIMDEATFLSPNGYVRFLTTKRCIILSRRKSFQLACPIWIIARVSQCSEDL